MDSLSQLERALSGEYGVAECNPTLLLELPDPCLLAVLQCCADDPLSLCSAARAHSKLHQAAVLTLSSITARVNQQTADSVMLYLAKYGPRIDSISLKCLELTEPSSNSSVTLHQLPHNLHKLESLALTGLELQLQQGNGYSGVLGAGLPLKQLRLDRCVLLDTINGEDDYPIIKDLPVVKAALKPLPALQHLCINGLLDIHGNSLSFSCSLVEELQLLTHLELSCYGGIHNPKPPNLQHLQHLRELRLGPYGRGWHLADLLSGLQHLTHVEILGGGGTFGFKPDVLMGQTQIQHLALRNVRVDGAGEGVHQLLSHLQDMQQLTHLNFKARPPLCRFFTLQASAPVAAYSALTASSKLQYLDVSGCILPAGVFAHMFPDGRQLPHLRVLGLERVEHPGYPKQAPIPDYSRLVSCCPGLQTLDIDQLQCSSEMLAPVTGLSSLQQLSLSPHSGSGEGLEVVCQLTGLRHLDLRALMEDSEPLAPGVLMQLTQLRQLTHMTYSHYDGSTRKSQLFSCKDACGEPVWSQLLQLQNNHSDLDAV